LYASVCGTPAGASSMVSHSIASYKRTLSYHVMLNHVIIKLICLKANFADSVTTDMNAVQ